MLKRYSYKKQYRSLLKKKEEGGYLVDQELNTFTFLSANLYNFLPTMPYERHLSLFKRFRLHQWLNGLDTQYFKGKYPLKIKGWLKYMELLLQRPGIICTYHFGAYQLINYLLVKQQIPYALLVAGDIKDSWQERYPSLMAELNEAERNQRFVLLNANEKSVFRQIKPLIQKGHHLLIYIDGMEGLDNQHGNSLECVSLLGQQVQVPTGAAYLSHWLDIPLYPLLTLRKKGAIELITTDAIVPAPHVHRADYTRVATNRLFSFLAPYLLHWPEQWTNWPQLHRLLKMGPYLHGDRWFSFEKDLVNDDAEYGLYTVDEQPFLLEKKSYQSYKLNNVEFQMLYENWFGANSG